MKKLIATIICMTLLTAIPVGAGEMPIVERFEGQPVEDINMDDVKLLAAVIWAEAEGEDHTGKRLVASTVLNRVDDERFPNTIYEVIFQNGQFTVIGNGRFDKGYILQEPSCVQAAMEELMQRTDENVLFFSAGGWGYGTPYMQYGNHYFCTLWR